MKRTKEMSWLDAILKVLEKANQPIHYTKIWDIIRDKHYITCNNCNPEITVNTYIQANKEKIVQFGDKGCYILRKKLDCEINKYLEQNLNESQSIIRAYGRKWNKKVFEQSNYTLNGKLVTNKKSSAVNLSNERGIYVLYNGNDIVYVGQTKKPLASRLKSHTKSLKIWDTFSWYGIDDVHTLGQNTKEKVIIMSPKQLIDALEAAMILVASPKLNKMRGNHIRSQEYQQM